MHYTWFNYHIFGGKKGMQTYSAFDEDFVHNGLLHEKIAVEEKHVEKNI